MINNIIFDWSGTISDDLQPVFEGTMHVFEHFGLPRLTLAAFQDRFILPYMAFYHTIDPAITKEEADRIFRGVFPQLTPPRMYTGADQVLRRLHGQGKRLIVLSSHYQEALEREVVGYGLADCFEAVHGGIPDKTKAIGAIIAEHRFEAAETAYVGDMKHDICAGQCAGITTIALTWGYQTETTLRSAGPDHIIHRLDELETLVI